MRASPARAAALAASLTTLAAGSSNAAPRAVPAAALTHGVASGDVLASSAVVWARADRATTVRFEASPDRRFRCVAARATVRTRADRDFVTKAVLRGLRPATRYWYRAGDGRFHLVYDVRG